MSDADPDLALVRAIADDLPVGVWCARAPGGEFLYANRTFGEIMGQLGRDDVAVGSYAEPYGIFGSDGALYPEEKMPFMRALRAGDVVVVDDIVIHRCDGTRVPVRAHARPVRGASGEVTHVVIVFFDIALEVEARRASDELAARLRQTERMQTVGLLASGIAHDFNNVLAAVRVLSSRLRMDERDPVRLELFDQLDAAIDSGAGLARQLVVLGGRDRPTTVVVSFTELASRAARLLDRTLAGRVTVRHEHDGHACAVWGVPSRLEQVLMNLAINARDAIESSPGDLQASGAITIRTRGVSIDEETASGAPSLSHGHYVVLEVSDTGPGIPSEIRPRIFEPYFTTRTLAGERRGTGLGLATVYSIVEAHGGAIEVLDAREPGAAGPRGTTMRVWLPAAAESPAAPELPSERPQHAPTRGEGGVLFVDDDEPLRRSVGAALPALGYAVLVADGGERAIELVREHRGEIGAALIDLVMPDLDGHATYERLRAIDPELPVVVTTGTPFDPAAQRMIDEGARELLAKPYSIDELARAIERVRRR